LAQQRVYLQDATRRIWAGERDAAALTAGLDAIDSALVRRVLALIDDPSQATPAPPPEPQPQAPQPEPQPQAPQPEPQPQAPQPDMAEILAALPPTLRQALEQRDEAAFQQALEALPPAEQQAVLAALEQLMGGSGGGQTEQVVRQLEPLLRDIAAVAQGDDAPRARVEAALEQLAQQRVYLQDATRRIWAGERDAAALTAGLDAIDSALVRRVLEVLEGAG
jgi:hypothetical protein